MKERNNPNKKEYSKKPGHASAIPQRKDEKTAAADSSVKTGNAFSGESTLPKFKADLHIHTVLSPCADLEMTPANIVKGAKRAGLQIIGITDHNSTKNAKLVKRIAAGEDIFVLMGTEITSKEEVHCLVFFEQETELDEFQNYLDKNILKIPNPNGHFGYQLVVDEEENILEMVAFYLGAALNQSISDIQKYVYELDGIFIPAHVNRPRNGIYSQLGFIPQDLKFDALGITGNTTENHVRKHYALENNISLLYNSDAHFPEQIGRNHSVFNMANVNFKEIKMALNQQDNRFVQVL